MIKDCLRIFQKELDSKESEFVLDNYTPKDGTYLLIEMKEGKFYPQEPIEIQYNKKTGELEGRMNTKYPFVRQLDYYSKLVEMNKPVDPKKIIHSNNYLSFFIKKDSLTNKKVTKDIIAGYYDVLKHPDEKYKKKSKSSYELYASVEQEMGKPDEAQVQQIQDWVSENLEEVTSGFTGKDYLKIFFILPDNQKTIALYQREGKRYLLPNIYNNNDSVIGVEGKIYGLPNDNMGMNAKKPFLENKTRRTKEPYLISLEEVLLQSKFFDYLNGKASVGFTQVYVDPENEKFKFCKSGEFDEEFQQGFYIKMQKGKEVELHDFDVIPKYNYFMKHPFNLKRIIELTPDDLKNLKIEYGTKNKLGEMQAMIDEIFFGKWLINNYFTNPEDISIKDGVVKYNLIKSRDRLNNWFYKGDETGISTLLQNISLELVKNSASNGNTTKAKHQLNLRWSLMDYYSENNAMEVNMREVRSRLREHIECKDDWEFDNDEEYYYAVGQTVAFYLSRTRGGKKPQSYINPFMNAKRDEIIKKKLRELYRKVNFDVDIEPKDLRNRNLTGHVLGYTPQGKVNQDMLVCGFVDLSLVYEKKKEDK
ncbi:MAG TPA: type I-B CRISPR-associated protein Cas8b/Csh1 [Clostridium sp.]|uniref:CRISPR-associated protein Csh1 n=1 Tax=Muricomes intestini TaxID=1796634 RepID=A0A4R3K0C9_9FIRM|nr:type I-B CRISPR-associated protein Cas8b/Csh1 [Muricomes intestini]TCS75231.1 CRISPR-associated protein Csh1 [Muricomes intestini]HBC95503.1 type I-B CRISPR-associated protein Cas8b/Csh1 [Clostridium sp.]